MAKDNKVRMPSSMAGITQYFEGETSIVMLSPKQVMVVIIACGLLVLAMHALL